MPRKKKTDSLAPGSGSSKPAYRKSVRKNDEGQVETRLTELQEATGKTKSPEDSEQAFISQCLQRFMLSEDGEKNNRSEGLYDTKFSVGDQWPADIKSQRGLDGRPCETTNRIEQFIRQVKNDELQNRPAAQINPVGDQGDPDTGSVIQGMFRNIEDDSVAEQVYSITFDKVCRKGWSWWRVLTEYESEDSFDQKIVFRSVPNDFSVYCDPSATLPDRSDAEWMFIVEDIPLGEYKDLYGEIPVAGVERMSSVGDKPANWISGQSIRVAEVYYYDGKPETLYQLANGKGVWESEIQPHMEFRYDDQDKPISRESKRKQLKWAKINVEKIIEGPIDVPCRWIPVIFMEGESVNVDGEVKLYGMVRNARSPQRMYNYHSNALIETLALAPKVPWLIANGQIEGFEDYWKTSNRRNWPFLPYKFITAAGQPAPAPTRVGVGVDNVTPILTAIRQADSDLMATMGIYQPGLGAIGPEQSGKAILARQKESDTSNAHYSYNRNWSLLHGWRVALDMMPHIYSSERVVRIVRPDNQSMLVAINQLFGDGKSFDVANSAGRYAVTLAVGSPMTRRQQAISTMTEILKADPQLFTVIGDLFVDQLDADGDWKLKLAERLRKMIPPNLQDSQPGTVPFAAYQQLLQQHNLMTQAIEHLNDVIKTKQIDNETKKHIENVRSQTQIVTAAMKGRSNESMEAARQATAQLSELLQRGHEQYMQRVDNQHEYNLARFEAANQPDEGSSD